eukprot:8370471-Pyramimonas_sp.AAC.1
MNHRVQHECRQTKGHYTFPMRGQRVFPNTQLSPAGGLRPPGGPCDGHRNGGLLYDVPMRE